MMKINNYESPKAEIILLAEDAIRTSGENFETTDNYGTWIW